MTNNGKGDHLSWADPDPESEMGWSRDPSGGLMSTFAFMRAIIERDRNYTGWRAFLHSPAKRRREDDHDDLIA